MSALSVSWHRTWSNLGLTAPDGLYEKLLMAYAEPHRHYHSIQHLEECIAHFSEVQNLTERPGEVEVALWFHDAIYALQSKDNESRSANWATESLNLANASSTVCERVHALILATCHQTAPIDTDQMLILDIDLAILGATPKRFKQYDTQVSAEYSWVPSSVYKTKRQAVLKGFLDRRTIFCTPSFIERYEIQARLNLSRALDASMSLATESA